MLKRLLGVGAQHISLYHSHLSVTPPTEPPAGAGREEAAPQWGLASGPTVSNGVWHQVRRAHSALTYMT